MSLKELYRNGTIDNLMDEAINKQLTNDQALWESLGPDALYGMDKGFNRAYTNQIRQAIILEDSEALGKLMLNLSRDYLDHIVRDDVEQKAIDDEIDAAEYRYDAWKYP